MVQNPFDFCSGKIGVNHQSGFFGKGFFMSSGSQLIANACCAAVLPHNGVVNRLAGFAVPQQGGLALICDADSGNFRRIDAILTDYVACNFQLCFPNGLRTVFHPTRARINLLKFLLRRIHNFTRMVEQDSPVACGSGVKCKNVFLHVFDLF